MARQKPIAACDCETDPFLNGRVPEPFIWGYYDKKEGFLTFDNTKDFVEFIKNKEITLYAHNGGKFDFMFLMQYLENTQAQIINGRIVSVQLGKAKLVDSFAAVPESLKKIKKLDIEYWKMEEGHRDTYRKEIIHYLEGDCVYLYELMEQYRKAAGTHKTIASNALAHARKLGIDPGKTNHRFDENYRPFYFGGRTECMQPGTHKNIQVFDIKSAYPFAMKHFHPTGNNFVWKSNLDGMTKEEIERSFIILECHAKGCFPIRVDGPGGLQFPHAFNKYHVTGWEYVAAKELGLVSDEKIISVRTTSETITFGDYVDYWFKYKNSYKKDVDPINYTIGKIMMNSLYGKLAQNPARYHDYKIMELGSKLPCNRPKFDTNKNDEKNKKQKYCVHCGFAEFEHGWTLYTEFQGKEFHRRESLWKYQYRYGIEWEGKTLYKNVATGASITGFTRAFLLRAMHAVGIDTVIYCDTDSIVCADGALSGNLPQDNAIGNWDHEIKNAPIGHFSGKKQYGIDLGNGKSCTCQTGDCKRHKTASKGARLTFSDHEKLVKGDIIVYKSEAPSFSIANGIGFVQRSIRRTGKFGSKTIN